MVGPHHPPEVVHAKDAEVQGILRCCHPTPMRGGEDALGDVCQDSLLHIDAHGFETPGNILWPLEQFLVKVVIKVVICSCAIVD